MAGRTDELHSFFARARAAGISIASDGSSRNAASHRPAVTIRTYDGLAIDTQVEYEPDGSFVVSIYKHRPASANAGGSATPTAIASSQRARDLERHRHLALPAEVLGGFVNGREVLVQQPDNHHRAAPASLPRSNRVWNFGNPAELHEMNAVDSEAPPPTYEQATFMPPPLYEPRDN
jgi:hypothetical protein